MARIIGTRGANTLRGTPSDDTVLGRAGNDRLSGLGGNDELQGESGNDVLDGGSGRDLLIGGVGADVMRGGSGNDVLRIGSLADSARDTVDGGSGLDRLDINLSASRSALTFTASDAGSGTLGGARFTGIEAYTVTGSSRADALTGGVRDDTFSGGAGNDTLNGGVGADRLYGGTGRDALNGGVGADVLDGGSHDDVLWADQDNAFQADTVRDVLLGGSGNDEIHANGRDRVDGGIGNDMIDLAGLGNVVDGGAGVDTASASGDGTSALTFSIRGTTATLNAGGVRAAQFVGVERFVISGSGDQDDRLDGTGAAQVEFRGEEGDDLLIGSAGNDLLSGAAGSDTLRGGAGRDTLFDEVSGTSSLDGGSGNDEVAIGIYYDELFGSPAASTTTTVLLGTGNDRLDMRLAEAVSSGTVTVDGGSGTDTLGFDHWDATGDVQSTLTSISAGTLAIIATRMERLDIHTGSGDDALTGGAGDDRLDGGTGDDTLLGLGGDDELRIGEGGFADGGEGDDHVSVDLGKSELGVAFTFSSGTVQVNANTSFTDMETFSFVGSKGNDVVTGTDGDEEFADGTGNDRLFGGAGDDTFTRGAVDTSRTWNEVNDGTMRVDDPGVDTLDGGEGFDALSFAPKNEFIASFHWQSVVLGPVTIDLQDQTLNDGLAKGLTVVDIERIESGVAVDQLRGSNAHEEFHANESNDVIDGRAGNDRIDGGAGADDLWGGEGRDRFLYDAQSFDKYGSWAGILQDTSGDRIHDFTRGQDKFVFDLEAPDGPVVSVGRGSGGADRASLFYFDRDSHTLWTRYFGDHPELEGQQVKVAVLEGVDTLGASDFLFA